MKSSNILYRLSLLVSVVVFVILVGSTQKLRAMNDPFPIFERMEANISFWQRIYSQLNSSQGIIHDRSNLNIIYGVVELEAANQRRARRINRKRIKKAKAKYKQILAKLLSHPTLITEEEQRISALFGENPAPRILTEARDNIRFQRGQKDRFRQGLVWSGAYIDEMRRIFQDHGLPVDLVYLPHVESSFNYSAYSKFGAAGIWQFMYGTGKKFMKVTYTVDERWDPLKATEAAARLLKINFEKLGSWPLAITAYNYGARGMLRAKKEKGDYETIFREYNGRRFRFASKNFYAEFLAARKIAADYEKYFGALKFEKQVKYKVYNLPGFVSIEDLSHHLKVEQQILRKLNLALREPVFRQQKYVPKGYVLRVPDRHGMETDIANFPLQKFKKKQKRSRFYYVRKGDVAIVIAKRMGVTLRDLIWANNLNYRATIYAGQNLRIPTPEDSLALMEKYGKADNSKFRTALREKIATAESPSSKPKQSDKALFSDKGSGTEAKDIVNPVVVTGNFLLRKIFRRKGETFGTIQVEAGETLGHYADWSMVKTQEIRSLNGLSFYTVIKLNKQLIIPLNRISKELFEEKRYEYHKKREEDFLAAYKIEGTRIYYVKSGDNIWGLCQNEFELPFWLIRKYNYHLDFNDLKPAQKLVIPAVSKS